ncbi:hypothetical protein AB0918_18900 [Streptomyces sp. NPDC006864]|uniref:hypothetical protein n=1 Tax=Streptomyces sp. NPDC006864 TaxID=3154780 RepID=UPI0034569FEA
MASPTALPRPRRFAGGGARRRLRSVPAQAGPVVQLDVGNPLQLTETMRTRLLAAVRALLSDPGLKDADDPVRLATVVLVAKSKVATNYRATTTATELGRWVGLKSSRVAHHVLPQLRDRGVLGSNETVSAAGRVTGLECWVIPMYRVQHGGDRRHVLALSRVELVVLLKLIEVLFAPGWNHKDGRVTPAGMIADRTGRGAATDRLGLLLMVLSSNAKGWLQLCSGSVDTERGRPAATVARLLGCSPAGGAKVLSRLQERDVLSVDRRETASGLNARSRVRLLPVAKAHGIAVREAREAADAVFSDLADTASGDHEMTVAAMAPVVTGVHGIDEGLDPYSPDRADAAHLHASHASGVNPAGSLSLSGGFSGEGRGGEGRRPERVRVREDHAVDHGTAMAGSGSLVAEDGPLRGEKPKKSPANQRVDQRTVEACAGGRLSAGGWERAQQEKGVDLPADLRLRVALGPVSSLWERLSGWQQGQVKAAAKAELAQLAGLGVAPEGAPQRLADRLTRRLTETGGEAMVAKPFGWLRSRGLVRRPSCSDRRCDDGIRLDTGDSCESCGNVLHIHRARRARMRADIDRELPGLAAGERRRILERRLRERVATLAENLARDQEQARAERARREAARAGAAEQAEHERRAAAAADAVRQALACEDCGRGRAAGLCEACGYRRRTETLTVETGLLAATWAAVLDDRDDIDAVIAGVRASLEADIKHTQREFLDAVEPGELDKDPVGAASVLAFAALQTVEAALSDYRSNTLERLGRTEEAQAEARRAFRTEQNRPWFRHNPNGADATAAATKAADTACRRTAEYLLTTRLEQLRARTDQVPAAPWMDRLHELAARPLDTDTASAVIA